MLRERQREVGLVTFTTFGQELERVYSFHPIAHTGLLYDKQF